MEKTTKTQAQLAAELTEAHARIAKLEREMEKQVEDRTAALRREIAERKRAEKALTTESDLLRALMETLPDAVYFKDLESRFIRINKAQAKRFNLEPAQAVGKSDFDFFTEEHARPAYEAEQEIIRTGQPLLNLEEKETWPNRPDTWVSTTKLPLRDHDGNVVGTFGISRDITERKQIEDTLARERNLLRSLIDNAPDYIYVKDTESRFVTGNPALLGIMGVASVDDLVGKTDFDFYPGELATKYFDDERAIIQSGQPLLQQEERVVDASGNPGWISTTKVPLRDTEGQIFGLVGMGRDITDRKQAEEALTRAYTEVEQQVAERTVALQREVAERERLQEEVIEAQRRALAELSTPIIPVLEGVMVMPLVGSVDTLRARDITRALLAGIREHRAKVVILDITGVPLVDSGVAAYLNRTILAARLKGARTIVTGISEAVAETIVDLGIDWSGIETLSDLQTGLRAVLAEMSQRHAG